MNKYERYKIKMCVYYSHNIGLLYESTEKSNTNLYIVCFECDDTFFPFIYLFFLIENRSFRRTIHSRIGDRIIIFFIRYL